jgi:hypothetical protein
MGEERLLRELILAVGVIVKLRNQSMRTNCAASPSSLVMHRIQLRDGSTPKPASATPSPLTSCSLLLGSSLAATARPLLPAACLELARALELQQ